MNPIYRRARTVIAWVGEASEDCDEAVSFIRKLGMFALRFKTAFSAMMAMKTRLFFNDPTQTSADFIVVLGFPFRSQNWLALWYFLEREFWTRVWIIQELAVRGMLWDSTDVIVCGFASVEIAYFDSACAPLLLIILNGNCLRLATNQVNEPLKSMLRFGHSRGLTMFQTLSACNLEHHSRDLTHLLRVTQKFRATDLRDKFYPLLGLASDGDEAFPADYTKPIREALKNLVKFLVLKDGSLKIIAWDCRGPSPLGPSWTPNVVNEDCDQSAMIGKIAFSAAGETEAVVNFRARDEKMSAQEVYITELKDVVGPLQIVRKLPSNSSDLLGEMRNHEVDKALEQLFKFSQKLGNIDREPFWRTIVMDRDRTSIEDVYPAPQEFGIIQKVILGQESVPSNFKPKLSEESRKKHFVFPFVNKI